LIQLIHLLLALAAAGKPIANVNGTVGAECLETGLAETYARYGLMVVAMHVFERVVEAALSLFHQLSSWQQVIPNRWLSLDGAFSRA
jgi:hypothetical protein